MSDLILYAGATALVACVMFISAAVLWLLWHAAWALVAFACWVMRR